MNTVILAIFLAAVLVIGFLFSEKSLVSPLVLFVLPFLLAALESFYYPWDISTQTVEIVAAGAVVFVVFALVTQRVYAYVRPIPAIPHAKDQSDEQGSIHFSIWAYYLFAAIVVFSIAYIYHDEESVDATVGITGNFSAITSGFNVANKIWDTVHLNQLASFLYNFVNGLSYTFAYIFAKEIVTHKWHFSWWALLDFLLSAFASVISGSRTAVLGPVIGFLICLALLYSENGRFVFARSKARTYFAIPLFIVLALWIGYASAFWVGRTIQKSPLDYISVYTGAPLKNLSIWLNEGIPRNAYFGQYTFSYLYPTLIKAGLVPPTATAPLPFIHFDGYNTGNVYTTYYASIADFGYLGAFAAVALMAVLTQLVFEHTRRIDFKQQTIPLTILIYSYLGFNLFTSFFSSNFYQNVVFLGFLKTIIGMLTVILVQKLCVKKTSAGSAALATNE